MSVNAAPWSGQVADAAPDGFTNLVGLTAIVDGETAVELTMLPGSSVTFDSSRSPYAYGTVIVAWPDPAVVGLFDPKVHDLSLVIEAGYLVGVSSTADVQQLAALMVIECRRDYVAGQMTLTLASDEVVPINLPATQAYAFTTSDGVLASIKTVVGDAFPGETLTWDTSAADGDTFATAQRIEIGEDRWDAVTDWADALGCKVWHDGSGTWWIAPPPASPRRQRAAAQLRVGGKGTVSSLVITDGLADHANVVIARYEVKSSTTAATITVSGAIASTGSTRPRGKVIERKRSPARADKVARAGLNRALRRGHDVDVTAAALYWVTPRKVVTIDVPGGGQERLLVESVAFSLDRGTMALKGQADVTGQLAGTITSTTF